MRKCSSQPRLVFAGSPLIAQIDRSCGGGKIIVVIIPDQYLDFMVSLARGDHADVGLSAHAVADNIL